MDTPESIPTPSYPLAGRTALVTARPAGWVPPSPEPWPETAPTSWSAVVFLVSDDASMIHGATLDVDGGMTATRLG